jgi:hypothetical protein
VRQLLNMLQMLTVKSKDLGTLSPSELQERLRASLKEVELGPLDAVNKLFNATEYQKLSLDDKLDLYFIDPSFVPLFVQVRRVAPQSCPLLTNAQSIRPMCVCVCVDHPVLMAMCAGELSPLQATEGT